MAGWIKLHRKIVDWEWFGDPNVLQVYIYCLANANHADKSWRGMLVKRGSFISSRDKIARDLGVGQQVVRTAIKKLEKTKNLTSNPTNKFTVYTIENYDEYQCSDDRANQQPNQQLTNNQPTTNQQLTTTKNEENEENKEDTKVSSSEKDSDVRPYFLNLKPVELPAGDLTDIEINEANIVDMYNQIVHSNQGHNGKVRLTEIRRKALRSCMRRLGITTERQWVGLLRKVAASEFLMGRKTEWKCDFDFICKHQNLTKIMEGKYDD